MSPNLFSSTGPKDYCSTMSNILISCFSTQNLEFEQPGENGGKMYYIVVDFKASA